MSVGADCQNPLAYLSSNDLWFHYRLTQRQAGAYEIKLSPLRTFWTFVLGYEEYSGPVSLWPSHRIRIHPPDTAITINEWRNGIRVAWQVWGGWSSRIGQLKHPSFWWWAVRRCPPSPRCVWHGIRRSKGTATRLRNIRGKQKLLLSKLHPLYSACEHCYQLQTTLHEVMRKLKHINHCGQLSGRHDGHFTVSI